jgi:RimJ/RimL family protein N-acetyltransferase
MALMVSPNDREHWDEQGFVVLPEFLNHDAIAPSVAELKLMFPTAQEFHDGVDVQRNLVFRSEFGGIVNFPFRSVELSLLSVHATLIELARSLLGCEDLRVYSIEAWAKYTGAADYEQSLHRDYLNHTMLVPSPDSRFRQLEMFIYLNDVPLDLGPPSFVSTNWTTALPALPNWYPRAHQPVDERGWDSPIATPDLYAAETPAVGLAGTVVAYSTATFHRGTALTQARGARYTIQLGMRPADADWAGRRAWVESALEQPWADFVARASPEQLALFGFPPPGHAYWNADTLAGIALRYPALDLKPWTLAGHHGAGAAPKMHEQRLVHGEDPVLNGALVRLRPAVAGDADRVVAIRSTPGVFSRWAGGDLRQEFLDDVHSAELTLFVIEDHGRRVIGGIQWHEEADAMYRHAGLDIYIDPAAQGRGYGTDAIRTLVAYLIDVLGYHRLVIDPAADNAAAIACYSKVGFKPVGVMRHYERGIDGTWHDGLLMDLLAEEFIVEPVARQNRIGEQP